MRYLFFTFLIILFRCVVDPSTEIDLLHGIWEQNIIINGNYLIQFSYDPLTDVLIIDTITDSIERTITLSFFKDSLLVNQKRHYINNLFESKDTDTSSLYKYLCDNDTLQVFQTHNSGDSLNLHTRAIFSIHLDTLRFHYVGGHIIFYNGDYIKSEGSANNLLSKYNGGLNQSSNVHKIVSK